MYICTPIVKWITIILTSITLYAFCTGCNPPSGENTAPGTKKIIVEYWLTNGDQSALLQKQPALEFNDRTDSLTTIIIDSLESYQEIDGFGFTLTGGSAFLINSLDMVKQDSLLKELFSTDKNAISISYLRISIGASDLSANVYTYDDMEDGKTDTALRYFNLDAGDRDLIPVLKKIIALNPGIKIMGSPWTAPSWMKTNNHSVGGSLRPAFYKAYANYFVKYIDSMKARGIRIDAITPQNEPMNPKNNPSMQMLAKEQAEFIKNYLGPALAAANLDTKIIIWDHNCDMPEYPLTILNDPEARKYADGTGFHLYGGEISVLSNVHGAFPDKSIYFTEQWVGGPGNFGGDLQWHIRNLIIGATRNWSRNVLEWNLASDSAYQPHTPGGCTNCLGALTIGKDTVYRNVAYYIIGHAAKFVPAGSKRIMSSNPGNLPNVAFKTPAGKIVLIVLNDGKTSQAFDIMFNGRAVRPTIPAGSVASFVW